MGPDALWHDGIGMGELVAAVRDRHTTLHSNGVGYNPKWGWKWGPDGMEKARAAMTGAGSVAEFERALRFLSYAGKRFGRTLPSTGSARPTRGSMPPSASWATTSRTAC